MSIPAHDTVAEQMTACEVFAARDAFARAIQEAFTAWRKKHPMTPESYFREEAKRLFAETGGIPGAAW